MAMPRSPFSVMKGNGDSTTPKRATRPRGRLKPGQTDAPLPTNPEAEIVTIGATLDYDPAAEIIPLLEPDDFAKHEHQIIWEVIRYDLHAKGRPVTVAGVDDALAARGQLSEVGGQDYILKLQERGAYAVHVRDYAKMVFDRARERALIRMAGELAGYAYNSLEVEAALLSHQAQLAEWTERAKVFSGEADARQVGVRADQVTTRAIDWLWRKRLAYGKLSILDGDPGKGKGLLGADLTARITTGRAMPDEEPRTRHEPATVILITPEDEPEDMIVPRLIAAGADLTRVVILNSVPTDGEGGERPITFPRDTPLLEQVIDEHGASFLIIDPIMACLDAEVKVQNDQEVRSALNPLKMLVARKHVAGLMMRHMNKSGGDKALYRGGGSIAFTGLARVAMLLAEHPDDASLVALAGVKSNAGKLPATLSFQIQAEHEDGTPHIVWQREEVQYSADALLGAKRSDERRDYIAVFQQNGSEMTPHDVALALGVPPEQEDKVRKMLRRMVAADELRNPKYGYYAL